MSRHCHCANEGDPGHPGWQFTRKVKAKTVNRGIPAHAVETTRQQITHYKDFKKLVQAFTEVNEALCDLRLKSQQGKKKRRIKASQANLR